MAFAEPPALLSCPRALSAAAGHRGGCARLPAGCAQGSRGGWALLCPPSRSLYPPPAAAEGAMSPAPLGQGGNRRAGSGGGGALWLSPAHPSGPWPCQAATQAGPDALVFLAGAQPSGTDPGLLPCSSPRSLWSEVGGGVPRPTGRCSISGRLPGRGCQDRNGFGWVTRGGRTCLLSLCVSSLSGAQPCRMVVDSV